MKTMKTRIAAIAASTVLAACGGGGDETSQDPQGFWTTETSGLLVTGSGEAWFITLSSPTFGLAKGTLTASGSSLQGSLNGYAGDLPSVTAVSGTVRSKSSMTVTASAAGISPMTATLNYSNDYDGTPSVASLAGAYTISSGGSATISSTGVFTTGTLTNGCTASGQITPDSSGKNFYRATVSYSGSDCAATGLTASGVIAQMNANVLVGGGIAGSVGDAFTLTRSTAM